MADDPITVLAVDDLPQNLRLLDAVLSPRGYRVVTASSGEEALELLPTVGADLVLLDIVMPGIDGYEVCRRIRAMPRFEFLPVVMITAHDEPGSCESCLAAGVSAYLRKPVESAVLVDEVRRLIGRAP